MKIRNSIRLRLVFVSLFFSLQTIIAQSNFDKTLEFDQTNQDYHQVYLLGEQGFLVRTRNKKKEKKKHLTHTFELFDPNMELTSSTNLVVSKELWYHKNTKSTATHFHQMYVGKNGQYKLISMALNNLETTDVTGELPKKNSLYNMQVMGDFVYFQTKIDEKPRLCIINWKTGEKKLINVFIDIKNIFKFKLFDFQVLPDAEEVLIYVDITTLQKKPTLKNNTNRYVIRTNAAGERLSVIPMSDQVDTNLGEMFATKVGPEEYIFMGTYADGKFRMTEHRERLIGNPFHTDFRYDAEGIFYIKTNKEALLSIELYDFLKFDNLLSFLPEKQKEKAKKKKAKGKKLSHVISDFKKIKVHETIVQSDGYIILMEAFSSTSILDSKGRQCFDGYLYKCAVVAKFDLNGELVWNNTFDLSLLNKPLMLKNIISLIPSADNKLKMMFTYDSKLVFIILDEKGTLKEELIESRCPLGMDEWRRGITLKHWFGNNFLLEYKSYFFSKKEKREYALPDNYFLGKLTY